MISYLREISGEAYSLLLSDFENIISSIKELDDSTVTKLEPILEKYMHQLPCVSFNGGRYDINLAKEFLIRHLLMNGDDESSVTNSLL